MSYVCSREREMEERDVIAARNNSAERPVACTVVVPRQHRMGARGRVQYYSRKARRRENCCGADERALVCQGEEMAFSSSESVSVQSYSSFQRVYVTPRRDGVLAINFSCS